MARADGIDVVLLHQHHVLQHGFHANRASVLGVGVVAVYAFQDYAFAVHVQKRVVYGHLSHTHFGGEGHFVLSVFVLLHHSKGVQVGGFGRPQQGVVQREFGLASLHRIATQGYLASGLRHHLVLGVADVQLELLASLEGRAVLHLHGHLHRSLFAGVGKDGLYLMMTHAHTGHIVQIHAAEDTAHAEHVLTLKIRAVTPAVNLHHQPVVAFLQIVGQVKLCHVVGTLCIAHIAVVHPHLGTGIDASEVDDGTLVKPFLFHTKRARVGSHGIDGIVGAPVVEAVACLDVRGRVAVRVFHVAIDGAVISLHLPAARHADVVPSVRLCGLLNGIDVHHLHVLVHADGGHGGKLEFPLPVQRCHQGAVVRHPGLGIEGLVRAHRLLRGVRDIGGHRAQLVLLIYGFVFPDGALYLGLLHLHNAKPALLIGGADGRLAQHAIRTGVHLFLAVRDNLIHPLLPLNGTDGKQGVAPVARGGGPLKQIVDAGVASAIVHVCLVESTANDVLSRSYGLYCPVLSAVEAVLLLGSHLHVVSSVVSVAKCHLCVRGRQDAIHAIVVRAKECALADGVLLCLVSLLGRMGGNEREPSVGFRLQSPFLQLVASVLLAPLHSVGPHSQGTVLERVNNTPRAGQVAHDEHLSGILLLQRRNLVKRPFSKFLGMDGHAHGHR